MRNAVRHPVALIVVGLATCQAVSAQVIAPPPRQAQATRPPQGGPTEDLTLSVNALGGYDRNPVTVTQAGAPPIFGGLATPRPSGGLALLDGDLSYSRSSNKRFLNSSVRGNVSSYQAQGTGAMFGGDANIAGGFTGRRNSLTLSQAYQNAPYYSMGVLGPIYGVGGNPTQAFGGGRTWTLTSTAGWGYQVTRTTQSTLHYSYNRYGYQATGSQAPFSNESQSAGLDLSKALSRRMNAVGTVQYSTTSPKQSGTYPPIKEIFVDAGGSYTRPLSANKTLTLSARGGATRVQSTNSVTGVGYEYWSPRFSTSGGLDLGRSWSLNGSYTLSITVPYALNTTPTEYHTHNASGGFGGGLADRVVFAGSVSFSNGRSGGAALSAAAATYHAYTFTGQMDFELTRTLSALLNVGHVETRMNATASQAFGTVPNLTRSQIRAGLSWTLPMIGAGRRGARGG